MILLFVPFRDESTLVLQGETAEQAFQRLVLQCSAHHEKLQIMLEAQSNIRKINDARQQEGKEEKLNKEDDEPQLFGEAKAAMEELFEMGKISKDDLTLNERVAMLNSDQRRVFENVKNHLFHEKAHEDDVCTCSNLKPLCMFLSGVGGTGKSFLDLIQTIKMLMNDLWPTMFLPPNQLSLPNNSSNRK